jgi:hypothetical protein
MGIKDVLGLDSEKGSLCYCRSRRRRVRGHDTGAAVALGARYLPARRAAALDPIASLKDE